MSKNRTDKKNKSRGSQNNQKRQCQEQQLELTNKMSKTSTKLDFWLDKSISIVLQSKEENLFHFVSQLSQASQSLIRNRGEHLHSQNLKNFLFQLCQLSPIGLIVSN